MSLTVTFDLFSACNFCSLYFDSWVMLVFNQAQELFAAYPSLYQWQLEECTFVDQDARCLYKIPCRMSMNPSMLKSTQKGNLCLALSAVLKSDPIPMFLSFASRTEFRYPDHQNYQQNNPVNVGTHSITIIYSQ